MPTKKTQWSNDIQTFTAWVGDSNPHGFGASTKTADRKIWTDSRRPGTSTQSGRPSTSRAHVHHHDRNVRGRAFSTGDLVFRNVQKRKHKLSTMREGRYIISELTHSGLIGSTTNT